MALLNIDTGNTEAQPNYTPIPAGDYIAKIIESEYKATSSGSGHFLSLKFQVMGGAHDGRFIFENLNLDNPSEKAKKIAYQKLAAIQDALSMSRLLNDSEELHGKPMTINVAIQPPSDCGKYSAKNVIKSWSPESDAPAAAPQAAAQPGTAAPTGGKKPWEK